jgi:hypothetical protein
MSRSNVAAEFKATRENELGEPFILCSYSSRTALQKARPSIAFATTAAMWMTHMNATEAPFNEEDQWLIN